ncbi:MAG TPA: hypothetical protein VFK38_06180, partial [Candidatus Limnocylindrales bacterium]|nr:hypothetical protein [Candidatus Limnocylindrales bacterium]
MDQSTARTKITPVPLRPETLRRDRLIDRLREGVNRRLTLVVAEAGYGKTTLLADFSQRGLLRCLWYKLDPTDRDWLSFCDYLVAAGREAHPDFGRNTEALLAQAASLGPTRELVVSTLMAEFAALGDEPTALILDDFHLVDDSADVREITRRLLAEAPETVSLVLLTRRRPSLSLGRLTAQGEVVEIGTDDLRFSREETERLFEEVYHQPLEPEVLDEIDVRTEGWAASLQLLHRSIRGRSKAEIRQFVRALSGTEGRLYDFLAEEVLRELPAPLRDFMVRASILERIVPEYVAAILADGEVPPHAVIEGWIKEAAGLGLMGKRAETSTSHRFHPLLREFLGRQLEMEASQDAIRAMHGRVARAAEATDWLAACRHFIAAGEPKEA